MDSQAIDRAMRNRLPVVYEGIRYERIMEYISWYDGRGKRQLSVALIDSNNRLHRVLADRVALADD